LGRLYPNGGRFATRPHALAGIYALLPNNALALGFCVTLWAFTFYLFAALDSSPFIYFQF